MPLAVAISLLADRFGFLTGFPFYLLLILFLTHYAVARRSFKESASGSAKLLKRHFLAIVINGLLCYCVTYGAHKAYDHFYAYWRYFVPSQPLAAVLGMASQLFPTWLLPHGPWRCMPACGIS